MTRLGGSALGQVGGIVCAQVSPSVGSGFLKMLLHGSGLRDLVLQLHCLDYQQVGAQTPVHTGSHQGQRSGKDSSEHWGVHSTQGFQAPPAHSTQGRNLAAGSSMVSARDLLNEVPNERGDAADSHGSHCIERACS